MRKLAILSAFVLALTLCGCAQEQSRASASAPSEGSASISASAPTSASAVDGVVEQSGTSAGRSESGTPSASSERATIQANDFYIEAGGVRLTVAAADTEAASALAQRLQANPVTVTLSPFGGFERVGHLPWALPASDEQITAAPGDVMLYRGDQITVFTGTNSWAYTPLGRIEGATSEQLLEALGDGEVDVTLSLA